MRTLLLALWPDPILVGDITFWFTGQRNKTSFHVPLEQIAGLTDQDQADLALHAGDSNVYFGLGLRRRGLGIHQQGGKKDIIALPGIALDIDFYNPKAHKATNLPADIDEAATVLLTGEPNPSIVVDTGNGVHLYWLFDHPLLLNTAAERAAAHRAIKTLHGRVHARAEAKGWQLDETSQIQRVWRVPGFVNQKTMKPVVTLHCAPDTRYSHAELHIKAKGASSLDTSSPSKPASPVTPKQDVDLDALRLQLKQIPSDRKWYQAIKAMLAGESFATAGNRDETLQALCSTISFLPAGRKGDPKQLAEIFRSSLTVWASEDRDDGKEHVLEDDLENTADKIERNQADYWHKQAQLRPRYGGIAEALGVSLDVPLADDDADEQDNADNDFFRRHGILQYRNAFYVFDFRTGFYSAVRIEKELIPFVRDAWADAPEDLSLYYTNTKGVLVSKKIPTLIEEYGTVLEKVVGNLHLEHSRFIDGVFSEAMARKRVTTPEFNPQIDAWMRLFAGERYELLRNWVATVTRLDEPNSCLYLDGTSGAGKSMLAKGLARLWCEGDPTDFVDATGVFNDDICECPLVWIDEGVSGQRNSTEQVRRLVAQHSFVRRQKFLPSRRVQGAIRLMICANNDEVLSDTNLSANDEDALVKRILYIHALPGAERFIAESGGSDFTRAWVEGDGLARHALWLAENQPVKRGDRFLVEGPSTEMHKKMITHGDYNGLIYEWVTRFATNPKPAIDAWRSERSKELARIGSGKILINTEGLLNCWDKYMSGIPKPSSCKAGRVLGKVSDAKVRLGARSDRTWFHQINTEMVLSWCESNQVGNQDKIEENLKGVIDEE